MHKVIRQLHKDEKIGHTTKLHAMILLDWKTIAITNEELTQLKSAKQDEFIPCVEYFAKFAEDIPDEIYKNASELLNKTKSALFKPLGL